MAKIIKGSCNWCGSCCGYGDYPKCALPYAWFKWDKQHPDLGLSLVKFLKTKIGDDVNVGGKINIQGVGQVSFYLSSEGLQASETDKTCPFYDQTSKECRIQGSPYLPEICKHETTGTPHNLTDSQIEKWPIDHPNCGFYWKEEE